MTGCFQIQPDSAIYVQLHIILDATQHQQLLQHH